MRRSHIIYSVFILICIIGLDVRVVGQERLAVTHFNELRSFFQPGLTGLEPIWQIKSGARTAFSNFDSRPAFIFVSAEGVSRQNEYSVYRKNALRLSDSTVYETDRITARHGFGVNTMMQQAGPLTDLIAGVNYAYHLPVTRRHFVSLGAMVGVQSYRMDYNRLTLQDEPNDAFYQQLIANGGNASYLRITMGASIHHEKYFISLSAYPLAKKRLDDGAVELGENGDLRLGLGAAFRQSLNDQLALVPEIYIAYPLDDDNPVMRFQGKFIYQDMIMAGLTYGHQESAGLIVSFLTNINVNFSYSYNYLLSDINKYTSSQHEFVLGYQFNRGGNQRIFW